MNAGTAECTIRPRQKCEMQYTADYQLTSSPILKKSLQQLAAAVYQRGNWIHSAIYEHAVRPPWSVACECPKLVKRLEQKCLCLAVFRGLDVPSLSGSKQLSRK